MSVEMLQPVTNPGSTFCEPFISIHVSEEYSAQFTIIIIIIITGHFERKEGKEALRLRSGAGEWELPGAFWLGGGCRAGMSGHCCSQQLLLMALSAQAEGLCLLEDSASTAKAAGGALAPAPLSRQGTAAGGGEFWRAVGPRWRPRE